MPTLSSQSPGRSPSRISRTTAFFGACYRILFLRWPSYSFDDLVIIQDSLDEPAFQRAARKMREDTHGLKLMGDRVELGLRTVDWKHLSQLPIDSLGYNTWHHFYANDLFEEIVLSPSILLSDPETEYAKHRYRSTHDLRHVLTGLGVEGFEEVILQSFQYAQLPQKFSALIVCFGGLKHALLDGHWWELFVGIPRAWRVGRAVPFLSNTPYESLWEVPLEAVRAQYGIHALGSAYPVRERHPDAPWAPVWVPPQAVRGC
ncbi:MAG: Coq4 family protein [Myxococcota bacterium]|nr:Coq4 family protein [Myxococcota bacterium]